MKTNKLYNHKTCLTDYIFVLKMDDKFKESQTNLTNLEIDLKEIQNILKVNSLFFFLLSIT